MIVFKFKKKLSPTYILRTVNISKIRLKDASLNQREIRLLLQSQKTRLESVCLGKEIDSCYAVKPKKETCFANSIQYNDLY